MREWLRQLTPAQHRVPLGHDIDDFMITLMKSTASKDLLDELELHIRNAAQPVTQL